MTDLHQPPQPARKRTSFVDLVDVAAICGAGLIVYGVSLMHRPAAFIVAGVFLLAGAWKLAGKGAQ